VTPADVPGLSRPELEHVLDRAERVGDYALADAIVVELAGRTWQGTNPYAPEGVNP
jgi:hypothetical protein